jgi:hypothetical protein
MSEFLPYILGSVASGMIGGLIGARRKQVVSGVVWGALLGPVGWIIVILLPQPVTSKPAAAAPQVHSQVKRQPVTMPRPGKARKG